MTKETFALLTKSYIHNFNRNEFTADELVGMLRLSEQLLKEETPVMFRFGKDSTILYSVNDIEKDLLYSTQTNREWVQEQIKHACEVNEIEIN